MAFNTPNYYGYYGNQPVYPPPAQDQLSQLRGMQYQSSSVPPMQQPQPQQTMNQGLLWVQGEAGAKSYLVAPNTTVLLMDSENQRFYIKSTDGAGMPSMRTFEYMEITANSAPVQKPIETFDSTKYVTRAEYDTKLSEIMDRIDLLTAPKQSKKSKEVSSNE